MSLEEGKKEQKLRDEAQVWSPELKKHVDEVERVQKVFTRMLYYRALPDPNYPRVVSDICTAFKILKGKSRLAAHSYGIFFMIHRFSRQVSWYSKRHACYPACRFNEGGRYTRVPKFRLAPMTPYVAQRASQPADAGTALGFVSNSLSRYWALSERHTLGLVDLETVSENLVRIFSADDVEERARLVSAEAETRLSSDAQRPA
ncbi:hypothetical protein Y032_0003g1693 [Ancylostoma ceylanicum]|uniref:Uncharacterized protein n=1 Tax=Ancylostoma ceylanicum TaxID=53326 RepID=A0A016VZ77_9BILA|nr:hypothetical protein Y032_0003g1693 [Ancylostoma ceylanicum]